MVLARAKQEAVVKGLLMAWSCYPAFGRGPAAAVARDAAPRSMQARPDDERLNCLIAQRPYGFEPMKPSHQDVTVLVTTHLDRNLETILDDILRNRFDLPWVQGRAEFLGHVYFYESHCYRLQHDRILVPLGSTLSARCAAISAAASARRAAARFPLLLG